MHRKHNLCSSGHIIYLHHANTVKDWFGLEDIERELGGQRKSTGKERVKATLTKHRALVMPEITANRSRDSLHVERIRVLFHLFCGPEMGV